MKKIILIAMLAAFSAGCTAMHKHRPYNGKKQICAQMVSPKLF